MSKAKVIIMRINECYYKTPSLEENANRSLEKTLFSVHLDKEGDVIQNVANLDIRWNEHPVKCYFSHYQCLCKQLTKAETEELVTDCLCWLWCDYKVEETQPFYDCTSTLNLSAGNCCDNLTKDWAFHWKSNVKIIRPTNIDTWNKLLRDISKKIYV